jgi:hypothetical protein
MPRKDARDAVLTLASISSRSDKAIPYVIDAWTGYEFPDQIISESIFRISAALVPPLVQQLQDRMRAKGATSALCVLASASIGPLVEAVSIEADRRTEIPILASIDCILRRLSDGAALPLNSQEASAVRVVLPSVPAKIEPLLDSNDAEVRSWAAFTLLSSRYRGPQLGKIIDNLDGSRSPDFPMLLSDVQNSAEGLGAELERNSPAVYRALLSPNKEKRLLVAAWVPYLKPANSVITEALIQQLAKARAEKDWETFDAYTTSIARIRPIAQKAIPELISALGDLQVDDFSAMKSGVVITSAVSEMTPDSFPAVAGILHGPPTGTRSAILDQLRRSKHINLEVLSGLVQIVASPGESLWDRKTAIQTLGSCGHESAAALSTLGVFVRSDEDNLSVSMTSAIAIENIAKGMEQQDDFRYLGDLRKALRSMRAQLSATQSGGDGDSIDDGHDKSTEEMDAGSDDLDGEDSSGSTRPDDGVNPFWAGSVQEYNTSLSRLTRQVALSEASLLRGWLIRWVFIPVVLFCTLLAFILIERWRRWLLVVFGRRWRFVLGDPDHAIDLSLIGETIVMRSKSSIADPREVVVELPFRKARWNIDSEILRVRQLFAVKESVRVSVTSPLFHLPWSKFLGGKWSDGADAVIAGQIAAVSHFDKRISGPRNRSVSFAALGCARATGFPELTNVESELTAIVKCWRRWGATPQLVSAATAADFIRALNTADLVHVAAHASLEGIALSDRLLKGSDLRTEELQSLRCRFLVLSACNVGSIGDDDSLVLKLVQAGINVLGSLQEVDSAVVRAFMEELYAALLPSHRARDIQLSDAIRIAVSNCRSRFDRIGYERWRSEVDALVLYGDPTLRLVLQ